MLCTMLYTMLGTMLCATGAYKKAHKKAHTKTADSGLNTPSTAPPHSPPPPQLLQWHKRRTTPLTQGDLRIYQVTPQSQWAPGFLVARALKPGGTELLDQRGAFLIHTHQCVYVWQGGQCPAPMAADAQGLAAQLVRYEAPEGTRVEVVQGGQEPEGLAVLLQAASEAGEVKDTLRAAAEVNKRMAAYDAWYKVRWWVLVGGCLVVDVCWWVFGSGCLSAGGCWWVLVGGCLVVGVR